MRYLIILMMFSLVGCAAPARDSIGYIKVKWHRTSDVWKEVAKYRNVDIKDSTRAVGAYFWDGEICHIFAPDVKTVRGKDGETYSRFDLDTLGHELKHCLDGKWH